MIKFVQKTSTHFYKIITSSAVCSVFSSSILTEVCLIILIKLELNGDYPSSHEASKNSIASDLCSDCSQRWRKWEETCSIKRLFPPQRKPSCQGASLCLPWKDWNASDPTSPKVTICWKIHCHTDRKKFGQWEELVPGCIQLKINLIYLVFFVPRETQTPDKESVWNTPSQAGVQSPPVQAENGKVCASALISTLQPLINYIMTHHLY